MSLAMHDQIGLHEEAHCRFSAPCQKPEASADISMLCRLATFLQKSFSLVQVADPKRVWQRTGPSIVPRRKAPKVACLSEEAARM